MPSIFRLTTPISIPNLRDVVLKRLDSIDEDAKNMVAVCELVTANGLSYPIKPRLVITNGSCDAIRANLTPTSLVENGGVVEFFTLTTADNPAIATAFDQVLAEYHLNGGRNKALVKMGALGIIPAGTIQ